LKRCGLSDKIDLLYLPEKGSTDLRCMFVYTNAIIFHHNKQILTQFAVQLSKKTKIQLEQCEFAFLVSDDELEDYAIELAYYCSVDTMRLHELNIKRNII
ncbi:18167_t:CDS:1, partial [Racocetra fulgida]